MVNHALHFSIAMGDDLELPIHARCSRCGYSLHGLSENRCPECGLAFDRKSVLANLRGERAKLPFDKRAARWLAAPPWWLTAVAFCPWVAVWLPLPSLSPLKPNLEWTDGMTAAVYLFGIATGAFVLKLADRRRAMRDYVLDESQKKVRGKNWRVLPLLCFLDFVMLLGLQTGAADIRFQLLLQWSEPAMNRLAQRTIAAHAGQPDQRVGFFNATWIDYWPDGMSFRVDGPGDSRFFYSPSGKPPAYLPWAERLDGHWFWYTGS